MPERGPEIPYEAILAALRLRDEGLTYAEIARRLGRDERSWRARIVAVHRDLEASEA